MVATQLLGKAGYWLHMNKLTLVILSIVALSKIVKNNTKDFLT
jgi:hypothetical protein